MINMNSSDGVMAGGIIIKGFEFFVNFNGFKRLEQGTVWRESSYINDWVRGSNIRVSLNEVISILKGFRGDFIDLGEGGGGRICFRNNSKFCFYFL